MKLSIWQQFSSNHSASYVVVGKCLSEQQAIEIAEKLKEITMRIRNTEPILENPSSASEVYLPTDVEKEIGKEYGFEWEHGLDWAAWQATWDDPSIDVYRNTVWFHIPHVYSWQGPAPIVQVMKSIGIDGVFVSAEDCHLPPAYPDSVILMNISFVAPDEEKADALYERFDVEFKIKVEEEQQKISSGDSLLNLPFEYYNVTMIFENPEVRLFEVEREGLRIHLIGVSTYGGEEPDDFARIIAYLETEGCKDIVYRFFEERATIPDDDF